MSNEVDSRKRQITIIINAYYDNPQFSFLKDIPREKLLDKAYEKYLNNDLSISDINDDVAKSVLKKKEYFDKENNRYDKKYVSKNHEVIYSKLEEFAKLLNDANIDYQLAGALPCYIKYGEESDRCHDDIDISINEKDIDKLRKVCEIMGLNFKDNRFNTSRILKNGIPSGEHEIIANSNNSDFHIGAFPFERLADGTIITKGYYHDSNNHSCCREDIISSQLASLIFGKETIDFRGIPVYITAPEYVYILKEYTNSDKDKRDREFLEKHIDMERVQQIKELSKTDKVTQNSLVTNDPTIVSQKTIDLQDTLYTTIDLEKDMKKVTRKKEYNKQNKEITRQLKKINPNTKMKGSISIVSVILALLVVFAILLIGLIIFTMIK